MKRTMASTTKRGRPKVDRNLSVSAGIMVQPRFPRAVHEKMRAAASEEGLALTQWMRRLVCIALAEREKKRA